MEPHRTDVWTFERLARRLNFGGCELLIVDAEGHDAQILRSLIRHCRGEELLGRWAWPDVIDFETAGHCDVKEAAGAEGAIVRQLERCGYRAVLKSKTNTNMVHCRALRKSPRLQRWMADMYCKHCGKRGPWPLGFCGGDVWCGSCQRGWGGTGAARNRPRSGWW